MLIVIRGCSSECVAVDGETVPVVVLSTSDLREAEEKLRPPSLPLPLRKQVKNLKKT
jgi:hypothetical protein